MPEIIKQIGAHAEWTKPLLEGRLAQAKDGSTEKLHLSLALVAGDARQVEYLYEQLLSRHVSYFGVIRDHLAPYQERFQSDLWKLLHDGTNSPSRRFCAGLALASYATNSPQLTTADCTFLAEELVAANPEHQPRLRDYLRPFGDRLLADLERIFVGAKATESQQLGAANALADFAAEDAVRLTRLLLAATSGQYEILYPPVAKARDVAAHESLNKLMCELPAADLSQIERVALGQRRAGAAITLLRQGERESILDVLRVQDDPESLTQFVHRCRQRGILPAQLLECLKLANQLRLPKTGEARRIEDRVFYALLLALGEFDLAEFPEAERAAFVDQLAHWCANDPSSAVHGATGWLLRHWKQDEVARKVDQTPAPYAPNREWYTLRFVIPPSAGNTVPPTSMVPPEDGTTNIYMTFVVFPAGEYPIGSVPDEADRQQRGEQRHAVKLTRPIAVSDREITWEQYNSYDDHGRYDALKKQFSRQLTLEDPAFAVNWYDAVGYCRWLSESAGIAEDDQAYVDPSSLDPTRFPPDPDPKSMGRPRNWPVRFEKSGFRLPTEAEWEIVCRSGTNTAYCFGNDTQLLGLYAWIAENSHSFAHNVCQLRPSARGLFDIHGNLAEWCHDWSGSKETVDLVVDPSGAALGSFRVIRGGGWESIAAYCRSAHLMGSQPIHRNFSLGFRVTIVPFCQASEAGNEAGSTAREGP